MNSGYYAAFSGLVARLEALDVIANNLANVNVTGFRGQREFYSAVTANLTGQSLTPLNRAINDFGVLGGARLDLRQGSLQSTGNNFDLAINGTAFFAVQTARGVRYTRNGSFHVDSEGHVVTQEGDAVLGPAGPIVLPPGEPTIAEDGTIGVSGAVAGQVRMVDFAPGTDLVSEGNSSFAAPQGAGQPATDSKIEQGMLESSNLNPIQQTVTMMALQRHAELLERTLSVFQNDFNKTAIEDMARD
ncbi:MAG: flagellar basal-body rod protein FlgF [Candidatus Acidiferrales bacterium]